MYIREIPFAPVGHVMLPVPPAPPETLFVVLPVNVPSYIISIPPPPPPPDQPCPDPLEFVAALPFAFIVPPVAEKFPQISIIIHPPPDPPVPDVPVFPAPPEPPPAQQSISRVLNN